MNINYSVMGVKTWISQILNPVTVTDPAPAYDAWAPGYDQQPGNLMLDLDAEITADFIERTDLAGKSVVDVGCGTGRHWPVIMSNNPGNLVGYDVSPGMLRRLHEKFPAAQTFLLVGNRLAATKDNSCDLLLSTLAVAHIENIADAFREWNRVLKPGGGIFITDYHPDTLSKGGQRTFKHEGKLVSVRNHVHPIKTIRAVTGQLGWREVRFTERIIDDTVREYYANQDALAVYEKFRGSRIIYGMNLIKANDTE